MSRRSKRPTSRAEVSPAPVHPPRLGGGAPRVRGQRSDDRPSREARRGPDDRCVPSISATSADSSTNLLTRRSGRPDRRPQRRLAAAAQRDPDFEVKHPYIVEFVDEMKSGFDADWEFEFGLDPARQTRGVFDGVTSLRCYLW